MDTKRMATNRCDMSKCAACGKGGDNLKVCTSCEQVSYCNEKCRNTHYRKHETECRKYTSIQNNRNVVSMMGDMITQRLCTISICSKDKHCLISDEELFQKPPPKEDCEICFLPVPHESGVCGVITTYQPCCGKTLCYGCVAATQEEMITGNIKRCCPFCRTPLHFSDEEYVKRVIKRCKLNDSDAFYTLAKGYYGGFQKGGMSLTKDISKAYLLFNRAAKLGDEKSYSFLAELYYTGDGVQRDVRRALHHFSQAAIKGHEMARHNLGVAEEANGNMDRAIKHFIIAAKRYANSLKKVGEGYKAGHVTKDEYANTLRAYQQTCIDMKSEQRDHVYNKRRNR